VQRQQQVGTAAATDVSEAMAVYQQARASVASYKTRGAGYQCAQSAGGTTVAQSLLPGTLESLAEDSIRLTPAGVSSSVLLRRPDIQEAEHNLKSANANIGGTGEFLPVDFVNRQRRCGQFVPVVAV
jgi:multidrug efflux system outer membrane protein